MASYIPGIIQTIHINPVSLQRSIFQGISQLGISVPEDASERLAVYVSLLDRWNRVYNLTAVRRPEDMVIRHILDSLAVLPWVQGPRVLDVGSGAGLPGIPLAIARPQMRFYLLDSNGKRTRFMVQAAAELAIANISVVTCRVQDYCPESTFDSVMARAFGSLPVIVAMAGRLCRPGGRLLAMKGRGPADELRDLPAGFRLMGVYPLSIPGLDAERHLVHITPFDHNSQASV